jgi:hypothetical protein
MRSPGHRVTIPVEKVVLSRGVKHPPLEQVVQQPLLVPEGLLDVGGDPVRPELAELGQDLEALPVGQMYVTDDLQEDMK